MTALDVIASAFVVFDLLVAILVVVAIACGASLVSIQNAIDLQNKHYGLGVDGDHQRLAAGVVLGKDGP